MKDTFYFIITVAVATLLYNNWDLIDQAFRKLLAQ